ncbi:MAG: signal peptidase I [Candidatus Nanoarchaeia archaeon]|nr:signal peptidase I [Candidatus Nanoarchaeia archaeon]MDD5357946.1 signal peptidase I [Candidatus Nanoarchaeia archaeon]MDD5588865.1 signal peptidase I [Candidatus Nanoarchaeia archaeon]
MNLKTGFDNFKKGFKKFWFLLWKDNSLKGWIFSLIFLFVFIRFIFFPFLSLVTGTALPLAIVESCSMYHDGNIFSNFDKWFESHDGKYSLLNVTKGEFEKFSLRRGFDKGDILFIVRANPETLKMGDVILFNSGIGETPVIHRIISIKEENGEKVFATIGDNNAKMLVPDNNPAGVDERKITSEQLVGKAVFRIVPWFGWVKLVFFETSRPESERGFCNEN